MKQKPNAPWFTSSAASNDAMDTAKNHPTEDASTTNYYPPILNCHNCRWCYPDTRRILCTYPGLRPVNRVIVYDPVAFLEIKYFSPPVWCPMRTVEK